MHFQNLTKPDIFSCNMNRDTPKMKPLRMSRGAFFIPHMCGKPQKTLVFFSAGDGSGGASGAVRVSPNVGILQKLFLEGSGRADAWQPSP